MLEKFRRERPAGDWNAISIEDAPARYQESYAEAHAWRARVGFRDEEAKRYLEVMSKRLTS